MKTGPILQLVLLLMLLAGPSEEFFFEYPKKALTEFFQSLKTKKQQPPKTDVQHYHIHYYPMPAPLLAWRAPDKRDLDKLYSETIRSFGWTGYRYKFAPDPSMMMMSSLQQLLDDSIPWDQDILDSESEDIQTSIDRNMKGILVKVPVNQVNQQVVLQLLKKWQKKTTI